MCALHLDHLALGWSIFHDAFTMYSESQLNWFPSSQRPSHVVILKSCRTEQCFRSCLSLSSVCCFTTPQIKDAPTLLPLTLTTETEREAIVCETGPEREWTGNAARGTRNAVISWEPLLYILHKLLLPRGKSHVGGVCYQPPKTFAEPKQDFCCRTEQDIISFHFISFLHPSSFLVLVLAV